MVQWKRSILSALALAALAVAQEDYDYNTCPSGVSSSDMTIGAEDIVFFETQENEKYAKNVDCTFNYKMDTATCRQLTFECDEFALKRGDYVYVTYGTTTKRFAWRNGGNPVVRRFAGDISVRFTSDATRQGPGAYCMVYCSQEGPAPSTTAAPTTAPTETPAPTTTSTTPAPTETPATTTPVPTTTTEIPVPTTSGSGTTIANPGGAAENIVLKITYSWSQETNYERTAKVAIPATTAGQKVPVLFHLHGNGGQGNTIPFGSFLGDDCIIVAPDGYERSWNVYTEKSKADDVQFILDLIAKVGAEIPAADMNNVNIAGTSNGAALTYQLLINTGADRPFKRAFPMVSSLIGPQYNNDKFWKFSQSAAAGSANNFDVAVTPAFNSDFEYAHFHGTDDGAIKYEGQNPGPAFLGNAEVIAAQLTDFLWAKAMGYTGQQLADSDGVSVGTDAKPTFEYKYLDGRARHYKLVNEGHGTGPSHPVAQSVLRKMILGV